MKSLKALFILSLFPLFIQAQDLLSYTLKPGELFRVEQKATQVITQEIGSASHEITNQITGLMDFKVLNTTEGGYILEMVFKDLSMSMDSSEHGELLNVVASEVIEGDTQSKIFNSLLDVPVHLELAKNGKVLNVSGGDNLVRRMVEASGVEDDFSRNLMEKSLEKEFGSEALSTSYEQMTYFYPLAAIGVGDSWENEYTGKLSAQNTWTLEELNPTSASISGSSQVTINIKEPATTMNLSGTQAAKITTDRLSGFMTEMLVESFAKGVSYITQLGDEEIPTTIKSTISYQLIK